MITDVQAVILVSLWVGIVSVWTSLFFILRLFNKVAAIVRTADTTLQAAKIWYEHGKSQHKDASATLDKIDRVAANAASTAAVVASKLNADVKKIPEKTKELIVEAIKSDSGVIKGVSNEHNPS